MGYTHDLLTEDENEMATKQKIYGCLDLNGNYFLVPKGVQRIYKDFQLLKEQRTAIVNKSNLNPTFKVQ